MKKLTVSTMVLSGVLSVTLFQVSSPAGATAYTVVDLTPTSVFTGGAAVTGIDGGLQVGWGLGANGNYLHALIWSGSAASVVDLNGSFTGSALYGISGNQQIGTAIGTSTGGNNHAMLWTGTAGSAVDLHPVTSGFASSAALAIASGQEGGNARYAAGVNGGREHAVLWTGTALSAIDIHPAAFDGSGVLAVGGGQQGGYAYSLTTTGGRDHAMLWTGTAASATDLNPVGSGFSEIFGVGGGEQVGQAGVPTTNRGHATIWAGTASSAIDIHPAGFLDSSALAIGDGEEVGYASGPTIGVGTDAMVWSGTAASAIDLKQFLPVAYPTSQATGMDSNGDIVGYAIDSSQNYHAIEWIPAPEPTSLSLLSLGAIALLARKRKSSLPA